MKKRIIGICILLVCLICTLVACSSSYEDPYDEPYNDADNNTNHPDVQYISNRSINRDDENDQFYFLFAFKDSNEKYIKSEATVEIRIVNDADETVYSATRNVKESDFGQWHNAYEEWMGASIYIKDSEISTGSSETGTFYYKITAADGTWFKEYSLEIDEGLPINTYSLGDTWTVNGNFEFTVDAVLEHELCDDGYDAEDYGVITSVILVYTYKNLGSGELNISEWDIEVYDSTGAEGDPIFFNNYCDHGVDSRNCLNGGSCTAKLPVSLPNGGGEVTIRVEKNGASAEYVVAVGGCAHVEVDDPAQEATCDVPGKTAGKHCTVCGKATVEQQGIAATGHNFVNDKCTVCGGFDKTSDTYKYSVLKKKADAIAIACAETVIRGTLKNPDSMKVLKQEILDSDEYFRYYVKIQYSASNSYGGTVTDYAYLLIRVLPVMDGTFKYTYDTLLGMDMMLFDDDKTNFGWGTQPTDWTLDSIDKFENPEEVSLKQLVAFPADYEGKYVKIDLVLRKNDIADREIYAYNYKNGKYDTSLTIYVKYRMCDNMEEIIMVDADYQHITVYGYVKLYSNSPTAYIEAYEIIINE